MATLEEKLVWAIRTYAGRLNFIRMNPEDYRDIMMRSRDIKLTLGVSISFISPAGEYVPMHLDYAVTKGTFQFD